MTSQLNVDTIVDKAGSSGPSLPNTTTIKVGNTSTYVSDGGAVSQNLVEGVAKAFHGYTDQSTGSFPSGVATHNISSYSDTATGRSRLNLSNAMVNTNQSIHGSCTAYDYGHYMASTTVYEIGAVNSGGSFADAATFGAILGDLA